MKLNHGFARIIQNFQIAISDSLDGEFFKKNVLDMRFRIREKLFVKSLEYLRLNTLEVLVTSDIFKAQTCKVHSKPACQKWFFLIKKNKTFLFVHLRAHFQR